MGFDLEICPIRDFESMGAGFTLSFKKVEISVFLSQYCQKFSYEL